MTIFVRTEEGQLAAYSADSALPRRLRSLLRVIDGKTSVHVYINSLGAFGDVRSVFDSFVMAGLIKPLASLSAVQVTVPVAGAVDDAPGSVRDTPRAMPGVKPVSQNAKSPILAVQDSQTVAHSGYGTAPSFGQRTAPAGNTALAQAVDLMSGFVLAHAPNHALMILKELEQLDDLNQLAATLGGYQHVISHVGASVQDHLLQVKQILRENM